MVALVATNQDRTTIDKLVELTAWQLPDTEIRRLDHDEWRTLAEPRAVQHALDTAGDLLDVTWDAYLDCIVW